MSSNLSIRVIKVILRICIIQVLLENNVVRRAATANNDGLDLDGALSIDRDIDISATDARSGLRRRVRLDIVCCNLTRRRFARWVRDYLQEARNIPILVERVVCFS